LRIQQLGRPELVLSSGILPRIKATHRPKPRTENGATVLNSKCHAD
jgi:hypothetical protein